MNKFCKNCGKELAEGTKFCINCGTKIENEENNKKHTKKLIIVLLILLIACLIIIPVAKNVLTPDSHKENEQQSEQQSEQQTDNTLAKTTAQTSRDYSKYIGTYTVKNEEGTKYESQHTLKIKEIDGKIIDFEYAYKPPRHDVEMTATQGNFIDETTALADGTYKIDGQLTEIAYKFKFNENSVECKFYEPGKEDSVEYTTFNLDAKDSSNSGSQTDDYTVIDTSTGTENSYTEVHKKGTGRQFKMTIEEFIEKHNQMVQDKGYAEKEEQDKSFKWDDVAFYEYPISLDQAIVEERKIFGEDMIVYEFWNVSKNSGVNDSALGVLCYKDTQKIFMVFCQVSDKWYEVDNTRYVKKKQSAETIDDYDNLPVRFVDFASDEAKIVNSNMSNFSSLLKETGTRNINYKDNVMYKFYGGSTKNGYVAHLLAMCACDKDFNGNINMYLNKMK